MIGAIILGSVAGAIARLLAKNDVMERMGGVLCWVLTLVLGLVGTERREPEWTSSPG